MRDTADPSSLAMMAKSSASHKHNPAAVLSRDLEATDPLARHDITVQFAGFRLATGDAGEANGPGATSLPSSIYFTYQLYNCKPTRTERMVLRPTAPRDKLYQAERGENSAKLHILVREGRYGRDEPSLGLCHSIDTTMMQPFEAIAFTTYLMTKTLFVDVWDGDALMHLGTLALPLRTLMRQQRGVVKTAMEYEVLAASEMVEGYGGTRESGTTVQNGLPSKGTVVGLVQVRGRPLSQSSPELSSYLSSVSMGAARDHASLACRGRGEVDADCMGYDELMLLVRRFRGSVKGTVWYAGRLLRLLGVPAIRHLEQHLVEAMEKAAARGAFCLEDAFSRFDKEGTGEIR
ncbi:unnamed protein product [Choristocarpus tenellus]